MTLVVLVILAVLWTVVLLPPVLRARTERAADSIDVFNERLEQLARTNGTLAVGPEARRAHVDRAAKRRREVLRVLLASTAATLLVAYLTGATPFWALQLGSDACLLAYLTLWAWVRAQQIERAQKVRYLPPRARELELALRRSASS